MYSQKNSKYFAPAPYTPYNFALYINKFFGRNFDKILWNVMHLHLAPQWLHLSVAIPSRMRCLLEVKLLKPYLILDWVLLLLLFVLHSPPSRWIEGLNFILLYTKEFHPLPTSFPSFRMWS